MQRLVMHRLPLACVLVALFTTACPGDNNAGSGTRLLKEPTSATAGA
jgi:hypothetical protein